MTLIVGLGNKARHGKDTAGEAVRDYYNQRQERARLILGKEADKYIKANWPTAKIYKWADALYAEVNEWLATEAGQLWLSCGSQYATFYNPGHADGPLGDDEPLIEIPERLMPDPNAEKTAQAPFGKQSKLLQWWGTEYRRNNYGQNYWVKKLVSQVAKESVDIALITDTRFPNEAQAIKDLGGYCVNVTRVNKDGSPFVDPSRDPNHLSETALDGWPWDFKMVLPSGSVALIGELAVTYVEYLRGLHE